MWREGNYYYSDHLPNESIITVTIANRIVGATYVCIPSLCLIPYLACLWVIFSDAHLRHQPTYIIIFHIGLADVLQLVTDGMMSGVFTFCGTTWSYNLNKRTGAFLNFGWIVYTVLAHVLAFNRYVWLCRPEWKQHVFTRRRTESLMFACWIYGSIWFIAYLTPNIDMVFNVYERSWNYFTLKEESYICWLLELVQDTFHCAASIVWYALCFWKIHTQAALIESEEIRERKNEIRLLLQAFLICVLIALTLVGFFLIPQFPHALPVTGVVANIIWLLCCANNCFVYLLFNKLLRDRVFKLFGRVKKNRRNNLPQRSKHPPSTAGDASELCRISKSSETSAHTVDTEPTAKSCPC